jgi:hypothetical protein
MTEQRADGRSLADKVILQGRSLTDNATDPRAQGQFIVDSMTDPRAQE